MIDMSWISIFTRFNNRTWFTYWTDLVSVKCNDMMCIHQIQFHEDASWRSDVVLDAAELLSRTAWVNEVSWLFLWSAMAKRVRKKKKEKLKRVQKSTPKLRRKVAEKNFRWTKKDATNAEKAWHNHAVKERRVLLSKKICLFFLSEALWTPLEQPVLSSYIWHKLRSNRELPVLFPTST